jgi:hypothetical protein
MMRITASGISSWIIILVCTLTVFNQTKWKSRDVLKHDMYVYYSYLPATFIYNDWSFSFINDLPPDDKRELWTLNTPDGNRVQKMTMGMAMMYAPAFGLAHLYAKATGLPADGYSWIYHFFMAMSALVYAIAALYLQRKLLLQYFSDEVTALTLLAVFLGTNVYYYVTTEGPMSHIHNFFLITVFVLNSVNWVQHYKWKNALFMGFSAGLIVLIRPVNGIVVLIPLLYGVRSMAEQMMRLVEIFKAYKQLIVSVLIAFIVVFPQMWYWKMNTGDWIYYSYNDEGFFFNDPKIWEGLFSYRKGWITYAPIMAFSLIGMILLFFRNNAQKFNYAVIMYFGLHVYIIYSWWCWWYGGRFGSRPMIDATAIMSIPLAACYAYLFKWKFSKYAVSVLTVVLVANCLFQTMQYRRGVIHWDSMSKEAFWSIIGKEGAYEGYWELMDTPDYDAAKKGDR